MDDDDFNLKPFDTIRIYVRQQFSYKDLEKELLTLFYSNRKDQFGNIIPNNRETFDMYYWPCFEELLND